MGVHIGGHQSGQKIAPRGHGSADGMVVPLRRRTLHRPLNFLRFREKLPAPGGKLPPRRGQPHVPPVPQKQLHPKLLLQTGELMGHVGLTHSQRRSRFREVPHHRRHSKDFQFPVNHVPRLPSVSLVCSVLL